MAQGPFFDPKPRKESSAARAQRRRTARVASRISKVAKVTFDKISPKTREEIALKKDLAKLYAARPEDAVWAKKKTASKWQGLLNNHKRGSPDFWKAQAPMPPIREEHFR